MVVRQRCSLMVMSPPSVIRTGTHDTSERVGFDGIIDIFIAQVAKEEMICTRQRAERERGRDGHRYMPINSVSLDARPMI